MPGGLYVSKWQCWERTLAGTSPPKGKPSARHQSWKRPLWTWHCTSRDGGFWCKEGGKRAAGDRSPQTEQLLAHTISQIKKTGIHSHSSSHQHLPAPAQHLPASHPPTPPTQPGTPARRLDPRRPCGSTRIRSLLR